MVFKVFWTTWATGVVLTLLVIGAFELVDWLKGIIECYWGHRWWLRVRALFNILAITFFAACCAVLIAAVFGACCD